MVGLAPALVLIVGAFRNELGSNPIETITHETGQWTLRLLLATLAVTPLRRAFGWPALAPYRRTLGLLAFTYASLHLLTYVVLDFFFDWRVILEDIVERPYVTAGFTGFVCLLLLATTSTRRWQRRLGRRWQTLHRLSYVAGVAGCLHFLWGVKADLREPLIYSAILVVLLAARAWYAWGAPRLARAAP